MSKADTLALCPQAVDRGFTHEQAALYFQSFKARHTLQRDERRVRQLRAPHQEQLLQMRASVRQLDDGRVTHMTTPGQVECGQLAASLGYGGHTHVSDRTRLEVYEAQLLAMSSERHNAIISETTAELEADLYEGRQESHAEQRLVSNLAVS